MVKSNSEGQMDKSGKSRNAKSGKPVGVVRFLGTNCDRDVFSALESLGFSPEWLWYQDQFQVSDYAAFVLPGGFSYGDYLRSGALAAKAPVMKSVREAAQKGWPVLGICNGFQVLTDSGLLPGALLKNINCRFINQWVDLQLAHSNEKFGQKDVKQCRLPIAHGDGRFHIEEDGLKALQDKDQIWWRYVNNVNGSVDSIAGVMNSEKNVAGLMPHPERAVHTWMGGTDGQTFFVGI